MANLSSKTRKELVLDALRGGEWVNTATLSSAEVGGTEGLRRLRQLRSEGYEIEKRRHPDPDVQQFQYRLLPPLNATYEPPKEPLIGTVVSGDRPDRDRPAHRLPWVFWKAGLKGTFTGEHLGCDMWVSPAVSGWVWRASSPTAFIAAGTATDKGDAKEHAIGAVMAHMEGL